MIGAYFRNTFLCLVKTKIWLMSEKGTKADQMYKTNIESIIPGSKSAITLSLPANAAE